MNQNVGDSVQDLQSAFEEQGYTARRRHIDLGVDYRSKPAVETDVGPVISVEDAVGSKETAGLKDRMGAWANRIRAREANPDIDKSVGLLNSGQAMPGESQAAGASGAAGRRSSLSQERIKGERGS